MGYGTGAIMAVPAHDERDWEFAKKFGLPIIEVVAGGNVQEAAYTDIQDGVMVNSDFLNGLKVADAKKRIIEFLDRKGPGRNEGQFQAARLGILPPAVLGRAHPAGALRQVRLGARAGRSAAAEAAGRGKLRAHGQRRISSGQDDRLGQHHLPAAAAAPLKRETDTMPQWAGSSWYFLRYIDPHNDKAFASMDELKYWLPVDWYNGGMEHTTLHLLYSRFWHRFLYDHGRMCPPWSPTKSAPATA